ncbi:2294_t:CDS:2, partial [Acaulospora morrowiae]
MVSNLEKILLTNIGQLYQNADDYNVQIYVGQEPNIQMFRAHSVILRTRSAYFRAALSEIWAKTDGNMITLRKPNISPIVFDAILKYIYTGSIPLEEMNIRINYILLIVAADELALTDLIDYIQAHIIKKESELLRRNLVEFLRISSRHEACRLLHSHCEELVCQNPDEFFKQEVLANLDQYILVNLLKKDLFNMEEVEIWENVIKWGIARSSRLDEDISEWTPEDFLELEENIAAFIPHIRFFAIPGPEFIEKIWPYEKVLPKKLKDDLIKFHVLSMPPQGAKIVVPRRKYFDSNIIGVEHFEQLASWIDKKKEPYPFGKSPYEFRLLMRGDRDGLDDVKEFQRRCSKRGPTIIVIEVKGSER